MEVNDASAETSNALTIDLSGLENATTTITGGAGADKIYGSAGDDYIKVDDKDTEVKGGDGTDTVEITKAADFTDDGDVFETIEKIVMKDTLTLNASQLDGVTNIDGGGKALTIKGTDSGDTIDLKSITF